MHKVNDDVVDGLSPCNINEHPFNELFTDISPNVKTNLLKNTIQFPGCWRISELLSTTPNCVNVRWSSSSWSFCSHSLCTSSKTKSNFLYLSLPTMSMCTWNKHKYSSVEPTSEWVVSMVSVEEYIYSASWRPARKLYRRGLMRGISLKQTKCSHSHCSRICKCRRQV